MAYKIKRYKRQKLLKYVPYQTGTSNLHKDRQVKALPSGKRISRTGKTYWETRRNRSDKRGSLV
jgi:hypothetical protein